MPSDPHGFEQDFILVTATEAYVRQATQYLSLSPALLLNTPEPENIWEWGTSGSDSELSMEPIIEEQPNPTAWETMLERL